MKRIEGLITDLPPLARCVVTVGKFDGVHRGHQALLAATVQGARDYAATAVALTFDRAPVELLRPGTEVHFLTTLPQRLALIEALGLDAAVVIRLTPEFLRLEPEAFIREVLVDRLGIVAIAASESFRFGRGAAGTLETLRAAANELGFSVRVVPPVLFGAERISSSRVVAAIQAGDVTAAAEMLGRPYSVSGEVVAGARLGRSLGYPTANLATHPLQHLPADGVYVVAAERGGALLPGVANLGVRPTVGGTTRILEAHFFDFDGDLYGETLGLRFLARLRDQRRFSSLDALQEQIARDVRQARDLLTDLNARTPECDASPTASKT
jgi:riboflavin kinase / FMN adenylyltransferase